MKMRVFHLLALLILAFTDLCRSNPVPETTEQVADTGSGQTDETSTPDVEEEEAALDIIERVNEEADVHLFESDIVLGIPDVAVQDETGDIDGANLSPSETYDKRNAVRDLKALWHLKTVPYTISPDLEYMKMDIKESMDDFEKLSCIRFRPKQDSDKNWVDFVEKDGCWSSVGVEFWRTGGQDISLGSGCSFKGTIMHEIMHALGFWHEQSRPDRNKYVEVFWENIQDGEMYNFNKYTLSRINYLNVEYDYESIMHYGRKTFSKNKLPTITAIGDPNRSLGQRRGLSDKDIMQLNILYDCHNTAMGWSSWTEFGLCNINCKKMRQRFCYANDQTLCPGVNQYGIEEEYKLCTKEECYAPVDGHWGRWSSWTKCDKDCGTGSHSRTRVCDDPPPQNGGKDCVGNASQEKSCKLKSCDMGPDDCEFDGDEFCHWYNVETDTTNFDWKRHTGPTNSKKTGPESDHTSGSGHYLYIETSSPAKKGDRAELYSKSLPPTESRCFRWYYHMYGQGVGALKIYVKQEAQDAVRMWEEYGDQGEEWKMGEVVISSPDRWYQVIIEGTRGTNYKGDIGIDDFKFVEGDCNEPDVNTTQTPPLPPKRCLNPQALGMESGEIENFQISSTTELSRQYAGYMGRVNAAAAWCAGQTAADQQDKNQTLVINFGRLTHITGIATQGAEDTGSYVTEYQLLYSADGIEWKSYIENQQDKVFSGNTDSSSLVKHDLLEPISAQFIKVNPQAFMGPHICLRVELYGCMLPVCQSPSPLGLQSFDIPDSGITATSTYHKTGYEPQGARLHQPSVWCASSEAAASQSQNTALQIDLGVTTIVSGVATQGQPNYDNWVTSYKILYSNDGVTWINYKEDGIIKIFTGNVDRETVLQHEFKAPFLARFVKINPQSWNKHFVCLRAELYGCRLAECSRGSALGLENGRILDSQISASFASTSIGKNYSAPAVRLNSAFAWCASRGAANNKDYTQYVQVSLRERVVLSAVSTQGQKDSNNWVTSYKIFYSNDASTWQSYQNEKVFAGNVDHDSVVTTQLDPPIIAQYVRINPVTWQGVLLCMRAELYGCAVEEHASPCGVSPRPLGMGTGSIRDAQITASTESSAQSKAAMSRLGFSRSSLTRATSWCAAVADDKQYLQIDIGMTTMVTGVSTSNRGSSVVSTWVTAYHLDYSLDGVDWKRYSNKYTGSDVLAGNTEQWSVVKQSLQLPVFARFVRINPTAWTGDKICLQVELYGCQPRGEAVGCYRDNVVDRPRPLPILLHNMRGSLDWKSFNHSRVVEECQRQAAVNDYKFYGVQFWGECWVARPVSTPFYRHGESSSCPRNQIGKGFQVYVYKFT